MGCFSIMDKIRYSKVIRDYSSYEMKKFGNAALNWQPFVITINSRQMFLHKFKHPERVKTGNCWENVLSLTTIENNSITLIFPGWKKVLRLALQILDSREDLGIGEVVFSVLEVAPFWLLDWVNALFQECLCLEIALCLWWWKVWTEKINQSLGLSCSVHNIFSFWMWILSQETIQIIFRGWNMSFNCKQTRGQFYLIFTYSSEVQKCYAVMIFFLFFIFCTASNILWV